MPDSHDIVEKLQAMVEFRLEIPTNVRIDGNCFTFDRSPEGRGFLFNRKTGEVFSLNATGAFIVHWLLRLTPPSELPAKVSAAFSISQEDANRDVAEFLSEIWHMGLLSE
ncbi:MAG TPA: PqqD family protein [Thermoguttaceae bacterium]|nr:PqqD family protein [Thermoguttaceae bacterium]